MNKVPIEIDYLDLILWKKKYYKVLDLPLEIDERQRRDCEGLQLAHHRLVDKALKKLKPDESPQYTPETIEVIREYSKEYRGYEQRETSREIISPIYPDRELDKDTGHWLLDEIKPVERGEPIGGRVHVDEREWIENLDLDGDEDYGPRCQIPAGEVIGKPVYRYRYFRSACNSYTDVPRWITSRKWVENEEVYIGVLSNSSWRWEAAGEIHNPYRFHFRHTLFSENEVKIKKSYRDIWGRRHNRPLRIETEYRSPVYFYRYVEPEEFDTWSHEQERINLVIGTGTELESGVLFGPGCDRQTFMIISLRADIFFGHQPGDLPAAGA